MLCLSLGNLQLLRFLKVSRRRRNKQRIDTPYGVHLNSNVRNRKSHRCTLIPFSLVFGNMPMNKIIPYAEGCLFHSPKPCVEHRQGIRDKEEGDGLLFREDTVNPVVGLLPFVEIKGMLCLTSYLPDGITYIKEALKVAEKSEFDDVTIDIKYIGAPRYMIKVKAPDYKIAESQMKKAVERAEAYMKKTKGECEFQREVEE